jgi:hypothetical protein
VAPSLRWATVEITKNERRSPNGSGDNGATAGATASRAVANDPPAGYQSYDEEPF